jgi:hypothetical protein
MNLELWQSPEEALFGSPWGSDRKVIRMSQTLNIERTESGYLFNGETLLPFGFNPTKDLDPIALHHLEELFDQSFLDVEFLAFTQTGTAIYTPTHQIPVTSEGIYLMRWRHSESDAEGVQFVQIKNLEQVYRGEFFQPHVSIVHELELDIQYGATVDKQAYMIRDTFLQTLKLTGKAGHTID